MTLRKAMNVEIRRKQKNETKGAVLLIFDRTYGLLKVVEKPNRILCEGPKNRQRGLGPAVILKEINRDLLL
ncbi:hypothetical protein GCM10027299_02690 [Larkinella ripae]